MSSFKSRLHLQFLIHPHRPVVSPSNSNNPLRFVNQYDDELAAVKKSRRPGRPPTAKEDLLKRKIEPLSSEHESGFRTSTLLSMEEDRILTRHSASYSRPLRRGQRRPPRPLGGLLGLPLHPHLGQGLKGRPHKTLRIPALGKPLRVPAPDVASSHPLRPLPHRVSTGRHSGGRCSYPKRRGRFGSTFSLGSSDGAPGGI